MKTVNKIKVIRIDPYTEASRGIKVGDIFKVLLITKRDGRDNPDRRTLYLVQNKKGKPITLYNCEIEEL